MTASQGRRHIARRFEQVRCSGRELYDVVLLIIYASSALYLQGTFNRRTSGRSFVSEELRDLGDRVASFLNLGVVCSEPADWAM